MSSSSAQKTDSSRKRSVAEKMEKLLFKKTLSDIQTADGFSDSCGFWFLCWHHYSRWEKGLQALQEFISENENQI